MINIIFDICVQIMIQMGHFLGISYQAVNIWIFVIIHPLITLYLFYMYRKYKKKFNVSKGL